MKFSYVRCDQCGKEKEQEPVFTGSMAGAEMISLRLGTEVTGFDNTATGVIRGTSFDFCSDECVGRFIEARLEKAAEGEDPEIPE